MKKEKGITLISLVITVIVLLILAGITISLILGDRGIFKLAQIAGNNYINAQEKELLDLDELYGSIKVASDGSVTLSMEDLKTYIKSEVKKELKQQGTSGGSNPVGTIIAYSADIVPDGYLACNGQEVSRTDYSDLFDIIGTTYGEGDGSTTFKIPDLKGEFLRGTGNNSHDGQGNGSATTGTHQDATEHFNVLHAGKNKSIQVPFLNTSTSLSRSDTNDDTEVLKVTTVVQATSLSTYAAGYNVTAKFTSRPTNTSVLYCIKY